MEMLSKAAMAFEHGGLWMWPILVIQLVSFAIIAERIYALYFKRKMGQGAVAAQYEDYVRRGELEAMIEKAQQLQDENAVARAAVAGAKAAKFMGGKDEIQGKMDEVLIHENGLIERRTAFLSMLGNVATLTGLLGTIAGMIKSFAAVSFASPAEKAALLSAGISEAMNCTAYGLIVAIPSLVAYAILQNRANVLVEDINQAALKVFNWLSYTFEPAGFQSFRNAKSSTKEINA